MGSYGCSDSEGQDVQSQWSGERQVTKTLRELLAGTCAR